MRLAASMLASEYRMKIGDRAPDFRGLKGVDGKTYGLADFADRKVLVVAFWCNHCPYVQAWEERFVTLAADYQPKGVGFVAINSNETSQYPEDDFPNMVKRAKEHHYTFPYLRDESQEVAGAYGGLCTPHIFVFDQDRKLRYQGRVDDSKDPRMVKSHDLKNAIDALLGGREPPQPITAAQGCSIKWAVVS